MNCYCNNFFILNIVKSCDSLCGVIQQTTSTKPVIISGHPGDRNTFNMLYATKDAYLNIFDCYNYRYDG